jgi:hypothetical protein
MRRLDMKIAVADRVGRIGCHTVDVPAKWSHEVGSAA